MKINITLSRNFIIILKIISIITLIFLFLLINDKTTKMAVDGWSDHVEIYENASEIDNHMKKVFLNNLEFSATYRFEYLFKYFAYGNYKYLSPEGALNFYPGAISSRGRQINGLEGFARFVPLAASWLNSKRSTNVVFHNQTINLIEVIKKGLINGTDPSNQEYWGEVSDKDQRIVEAADIALAIWLSKDYIWVNLTTSEKSQIVSWLRQSIHKEVVDNNWSLFPITIVKVLQALGYASDYDSEYIKKLYGNYKSKHYLGEGWFDDPPKGIDYYNAWAIHYSLFWLDQIDPNFDRQFIRNSHSEFVKFYKHIFSIDGFPIMGRSVCYRLAAPSPVVSSAHIVPEEISAGFAFRTLDVTWMHFVKNNALQEGKVTQGLYEDDLRLLDNYSGAGSCLWSLRSLVVAFYVDRHVSLFKAEEEPLPVELSDFLVTNETIKWRIIGTKATNEIVLELDSNVSNSSFQLKEHDIIDKIKEFIIKRPFRPNNEDALYKNYKYSNKVHLFKDD